MSENMALALSAPIQIPKLTPDYLNLSAQRSSSAPDHSVYSPGGTRRTIPAGQQFGRYHQQQQQQQQQQKAPNRNLNSKTPSTMSLEAIAALLSSSPEDDVHDLSPPARSKGYFLNRPKERLRKSQSFPILKPQNHHSIGNYKQRPPIRKARSVKFADSEGLPLASVRKLTAADPFQTEGEIVPKLLQDLGALSLKKPISTAGKDKMSSPKVSSRKLHFHQPGTRPDFFSTLKTQSVSLESISTSQPRAIHGIVRVMNIAYDKTVIVRWTHDNWRTHHDSTCCYCQGSSDGLTDRFSFTLPANGDDIAFAICYKVEGTEYWDSYNGQNYLITVDD